MTTRLPVSPAPGPLEAFAQHFDPLFSQRSQRQAFRDYLAALLLPAERNKTLTALANTEPIVGAQDATGRRDERLWLRFVDGRPVSAITTQFLDWCCERLAAQGETALLLVWDNASWHVSQAVGAWIGSHNRAVKRGEAAVRIVICPLPTKSPWLNPIEPKWMHGKRWIVEPARLLTAGEIVARVCACFSCPHEPHLHAEDVS